MTGGTIGSVLALLAARAVTGAAAFAQEPRIADNSFLVEEAYNQEPRVVQHISSLVASGSGHRTLAYTFTQEWPVAGQRHQLSYTVPVNLGDSRGTELGDVMLNYRYQLAHGRRVSAAPRVSLVLPTGSWSKGFGTGSPGAQLSLPVSTRLAGPLVFHANAGLTFLPAARAPGGVRRALTTYALAASLIGPVTQPVNGMLEVQAVFDADVGDSGAVRRSTDVIVNPGFRFAIQAGRVQIVPGFAVPLHLRAPGHPRDLFFYLSFEHPYRSA